MIDSEPTTSDSELTPEQQEWHTAKIAELKAQSVRSSRYDLTWDWVCETIILRSLLPMPLAYYETPKSNEEYGYKRAVVIEHINPNV